MKVAIINKSDTIGGAAVVSRRLMDALRDAGVDARMIVTDRRTDSPYVELAAGFAATKIAFLQERLGIFSANGLNRADLFKVDTAAAGVPLWRHPWVREADVICLNWVNQGMLSLHGLRKLLALGKPVVWTMHDMWCFTGICHHAGSCANWHTGCGNCPLLGRMAFSRDLSSSVFRAKQKAYTSGGKLHFVAVSHWLANRALQSPLIGKEASLSVIPNAFPIPVDAEALRREAAARRTDNDFIIAMGAARLDDPVKGFPILIQATRILRDNYPDVAARMKLVTFGNIRNPRLLDDIAIRHTHLGVIAGEHNVRNVYLGADAVVSSSLYETLPGTLVEGLVYGCVPVSFNRGGQSDIVTHGHTGYIAEWSDDAGEAATRLARGLVWAEHNAGDEMRRNMLESARKRFAARSVAGNYLDLFNSLLKS